MHVQHSEGNEDRKGNDLLDDLELRERQRHISDSIRWNLEQVFAQGDRPAHERGDYPRFVCQVAQVCVPCKRHERVGHNKKSDRYQDSIDISPDA